MKKKHILSKYLNNNFFYYFQVFFFFFFRFLFLLFLLIIFFYIFSFEIAFEFFPDVLVDNFDMLYKNAFGATFLYGTKGYFTNMTTSFKTSYLKWKLRTYTRKVQLLKAGELLEPLEKYNIEIMDVYKKKKKLQEEGQGFFNEDLTNLPLLNSLPERIKLFPDYKGTAFLNNRLKHAEYLGVKQKSFLGSLISSLRFNIFSKMDDSWRKAYLERILNYREIYYYKTHSYYYSKYRQRYRFTQPYYFYFPFTSSPLHSKGPVLIPDSFYFFYRKLFGIHVNQLHELPTHVSFFSPYYNLLNKLERYFIVNQRKPPFLFSGSYRNNQFKIKRTIPSDGVRRVGFDILRYDNEYQGDELIREMNTERGFVPGYEKRDQYGYGYNGDYGFGYKNTNVPSPTYIDNLNFGEYFLDAKEPKDWSNLLSKIKMPYNLHLELPHNKTVPLDANVLFKPDNKSIYNYKIGLPYTVKVDRVMSGNETIYYYDTGPLKVSKTKVNSRVVFWKSFIYRFVYRNKDFVFNVIDKDDFHLLFLRTYRSLFNLPKFDYIEFFFSFFFKSYTYSLNLYMFELQQEFFKFVKNNTVLNSFFTSNRAVKRNLKKIYLYFLYRADDKKLSKFGHFFSYFYFNFNYYFIYIFRIIFLCIIFYFIVYKFFVKSKLLSESLDGYDGFISKIILVFTFLIMANYLYDLTRWKYLAEMKPEQNQYWL